MVELIDVSEKIPKFVPITRNKDGSFNIPKEIKTPEHIPLTRNEDGTFSVSKAQDDNDDFIAGFLNKEEIKINENAFDDIKTSTVLEETVATFEKQAAFLGLIANAYDLVSDEDVASFIAERSTALHNAQLHAPEYVKRFQRDFEAAEGFFESAGVMLANPRALGRLVVTQTPNSVLPLTIGLTGGVIGSSVPLVGSIIGFAGGTFIGGSIVEIGAWIDQRIQEKGVNMADPEEILKVLQDDVFMKEILREAEKKGLSTAAVDTLFTLFGGRLLAGAKRGVVSKVGRFAGDVSIESIGEAAGEAAGQVAATGEIEGKEVALEGVAGFGQSTGQVIALSSFRKALGKEKIKKEEKIGKEKEEAKKPTEVLMKDLEKRFKEKEAEAKRTPEQRVKRKEALAKAVEKKEQKETLKKIEAGSKPLVEKPTVRAGGVEGQLNTIDKFQNTLAQAFNTVKKKFIAITPMNVVFDLMDTATKPFTGINFMTFKRPIDIANRERATQKAKVEDPILEFRDKAKLSGTSFRKILVIATLQQEKGRQKLLRSFTEKELDAAEAKGLTEDEQTMLDMMRKEFEKLKPQLIKIMKEVYGKDFKEVRDFFPMLTDFEAMENTEIQNMFGDDAPLLDLIIPERKPSTKEVSTKFLSERVGGAIPIQLNALSVFIKHVDNATYLINMGKEIQELLELAKTDAYKSAVGSIGQDQVMNWLKLMARRGGAENGSIGSLDWLRKNVGVAVLGYKLSTILIQPTALLDGATIIGGYAFKGAKNVLFNSEWRKFIRENFVEIQIRVADDPAFAAFMENIVDETIIDKIKKNAFWGVRKMDGITASAIAAGAYEKIVTEKGDVVDFSKPDQEAIIEAELIVSRSQASAQFKDVPAAVSQGAFTGNVSVDKLIFQFQTFMLGRFSLVTHALLKQGLRPTQENVNLVTYLTLALIAEVFIRRGSEEIIAALAGDEPDEPLSDVFFEKLIAEAIGSVPVVAQAVNAVRYKQVPIPVISFAQQGIERAGLSIKTKDDKKKLIQAARAITILSGVIGGVPGTSQIDQIIGKIFKENKKKKTIGRFK